MKDNNNNNTKQKKKLREFCGSIGTKYTNEKVLIIPPNKAEFGGWFDHIYTLFEGERDCREIFERILKHLKIRV